MHCINTKAPIDEQALRSKVVHCHGAENLLDLAGNGDAGLILAGAIRLIVN